MKSQIRLALAASLVAAALPLASCDKRSDVHAADDTGPHPATVEPDMDANNFKVDHPYEFPVTTAGSHQAITELNVTGTVSPDVSRQVPVISLASGRVVEIDAKLGDTVKKGQLLFKVRSPDIAQAFSDYQKAIKNEELAKVQLDRAKLLFDKGAVPKSQAEIAQNAEDNAKVDVATTTEHLHVLGADVNHPTGIVSVFAPVSGVITDQQITAAAGVQAFRRRTHSRSQICLMSGSSAMSMKTICLRSTLGEFADIHLNAYPDQVLKARIGNIGQIMDPSHSYSQGSTGSGESDIMRLGMFVTATFHGRRK